MKIKKLSTQLFLAVCALATIASCEKEGKQERKDNLIPQTSTETVTIKQKDGMLQFENSIEMSLAITKFTTMTKNERISWGVSNNFKTQQILVDEMSVAQETFEKTVYSGTPEGLSIEELKSRGFTKQLSSEYINLLNKGIIVEKEEADGSISYGINQFDPLIGFVLNEGGYVLVDTNIYYYTSDLIRLKRYESTNDMHLLKHGSADNSSISEFNLAERSTCNTFYLDNIWGNHGTLTNPTWYYDASDKRFKHYVNFSSCIGSSTTSLNTTFYTEARAEKRLFWVWDTRNNYNPIDYINGNWTYSYTLRNSVTYAFDTNYNDLSGGNSSPFTLNPSGTTNLLGAYLNPNTVAFTSSPWYFYSPVTVDGSWGGYFIGDTGNYTTSYSN